MKIGFSKISLNWNDKLSKSLVLWIAELDPEGGLLKINLHQAPIFDHLDHGIS